jgi:hypothetical protein
VGIFDDKIVLKLFGVVTVNVVAVLALAVALVFVFATVNTG